MKWKPIDDKTPRDGRYILATDGRNIATIRWVRPSAERSWNPLASIMAGTTGYWQCYGSVMDFDPTMWSVVSLPSAGTTNTYRQRVKRKRFA